MTSERRNVWKVVESKELYDAIMKMNEWEQSAADEYFGSDFVIVSPDMATPEETTSTLIEDDAIKQPNCLMKTSPRMEKDKLENISKRDDELIHDFPVFEGDSSEQLDSLTESFVMLDKDELENYHSSNPEEFGDTILAKMYLLFLEWGDRQVK